MTAVLYRRAMNTSAGTGAMAHRVSQGSTASMAPSAPTKASAVETVEIVPKPTSERMAVTSLVARAIRSPVVNRAKAAGGNVWTAAYSRASRSEAMRCDPPTIANREASRATPLPAAQRTMRAT